jgi:hypothetical protein
MCANKPKSWTGKLSIDRKKIIEKTGKNFAGIKAGRLMLIPAPKIVDAYKRQIPGKAG